MPSTDQPEPPLLLDVACSKFLVTASPPSPSFPALNDAAMRRSSTGMLLSPDAAGVGGRPASGRILIHVIHLGCTRIEAREASALGQTSCWAQVD